MIRICFSYLYCHYLQNKANHIVNLRAVRQNLSGKTQIRRPKMFAALFKT